MSKDLCLRLAGSGGQGVILCSVILAEAGLEAGHYVAQSQSYGPEARGGTCKAETVISDSVIDFPKVEKSNFLLALTQGALEKYAAMVEPGTVVMADASLTIPQGLDATVVTAPILHTAAEELKKPMVANIIAAGVINRYLHIASDEEMETAVLAHVPKGTEELNRKALAVGAALPVTPAN